jgi:arsenate reductase
VSPPIRVLFLCTGNSARSIIAEAVLRHLAGASFEAHSAGSAPKGVHPRTQRVLGEAGIDTGALRSKHVDEYAGRTFDYVVTLCDEAAEHCPVFPGETRRLHWSLADPAAVDDSEEAQSAAFRATLTELRERIDRFLEEAVLDDARVN